MEILKRIKLKPKKPWSKLVTCHGNRCISVLRIYKNDLYRVTRLFRLCEEYYTAFTCSVCDAENLVDVPDHIQLGLPSKSNYLKQTEECPDSIISKGG